MSCWLLKTWLGVPSREVMIRRGRWVTTYLHKQWLCRRDPGQSGLHMSSRSQASGWASNHRTSMKYDLSVYGGHKKFACVLTINNICPHYIYHVSSWIYDHVLTINNIWPHYVYHVSSWFYDHVLVIRLSCCNTFQRCPRYQMLKSTPSTDAYEAYRLATQRGWW